MKNLKKCNLVSKIKIVWKKKEKWKMKKKLMKTKKTNISFGVCSKHSVNWVALESTPKHLSLPCVCNNLYPMDSHVHEPKLSSPIYHFLLQLCRCPCSICIRALETISSSPSDLFLLQPCTS